MKLSRRLFCALPVTIAGAAPERVVRLSVEVEALNFGLAAAVGERVTVRLTGRVHAEALTRTRWP